MKTIYSLHKIDNTENFSFRPAEYSRFKFGDETIADNFGTTLAVGFIDNFMERHPINNQIVVISSPYAFIPTATFAMKNYFVYKLNAWLAENNQTVVQEAKVYRAVTYKEDYGSLSAEERINLISNDSFHIDKSFLLDKTLLFLDDIKITGSHERLITKMINENELLNDTYFLYFAELINHCIHPNIENYLNYYKVKSIFDLDSIISEKFYINTRIVKFILNADENSFKEFIENQNADFIRLLYNMALGNSYHLMEAYSTNLNFLKNKIILKQSKCLQHGY